VVDSGPLWLLAAATTLRVLSGVLFGHASTDARTWLAAIAGILAWTAVALFAVSVARALRKEPRMKALLADAVATSSGTGQRRPGEDRS
jgi:hypothetical protein